MMPQPPMGQGPIDPRQALQLPPPPGAAGNAYAAGSPAGPQPSAPPQTGRAMMNQNMSGPLPGGLYGSPAPQGAYQSAPGGYQPPPGWNPMGGYPPGMSPPAMRPPGGWGRRALLAGVLFALGCSVFINFAMMASSATGGGSGQSTVVSGNAHEEVAVIPVEGLIDGTMEARVERYLNRAQSDGNVKAVIFLVDSPGGSVTASDEIYKRIRKFKADKNLPVVIAMRGLAASGGYYIACAGDYITAERGTLTGNIGVLMPRFNISKLMEKYGVEESTIVSKGTIYKNAGSMFKPGNDRDDAYFQDIIDSAFSQFKGVIEEGRKGRLKANLADIANGKAYLAPQALAYGLIDEIDDTGYLDAAIKYAARQSNLEKPTVVEYHETPTFVQRLMSSKFSAANFSTAAPTGGVSINVDAAMLRSTGLVSADVHFR